LPVTSFSEDEIKKEIRLTPGSPFGHSRATADYIS
jgi:hypothetical protein